MSDDPIRIIIKLDDDKFTDLNDFLDFWRDRGCSIDKLKGKDNLFFLCEYIWHNEKTYPLNFNNYNTIFLQEGNSEIQSFFADISDTHQSFESYIIRGPLDKDAYPYYTIEIGLTYSFLNGKILGISIMNQEANYLIEQQGYEMGDQFLFNEVVFKTLDPLKILYIDLSIPHQYYIDFFSEENKDNFKKNVVKEKKEDSFFMITYYNKNWIFKDYIDAGLYSLSFDKLWLMDMFYILNSNIYIDKFNAPQEIIKKCLEQIREFYPKASILDFYKK